MSVSRSVWILPRRDSDLVAYRAVEGHANSYVQGACLAGAPNLHPHGATPDRQQCAPDERGDPGRAIYGGSTPITWDTIEPNSFNALQTYRMTHDSDWLSCTVGHMRLHFQCQTQQVSRAYPPLGWEAPLPLLQDELRRRLMLVQRIFDSLKLLALA